jgi:predicted metal-dependent RNase
MGRRVQKGLNEVTVITPEGKLDVVKVNLRVESIEGFSGHSDRRQIINYLTHLKPNPERVVVCHGERAKCLSIANFVDKRCGIHAFAPALLETFRLL